MLGDEMIFILTTTCDGVANDRIAVTDNKVLFRSIAEMAGHDYEIDITDTRMGSLLLKVVIHDAERYGGR
jgi:hypothetical protein